MTLDQIATKIATDSKAKIGTVGAVLLLLWSTNNAVNDVRDKVTSLQVQLVEAQGSLSSQGKQVDAVEERVYRLETQMRDHLEDVGKTFVRWDEAMRRWEADDNKKRRR